MPMQFQRAVQAMDVQDSASLPRLIFLPKLSRRSSICISTRPVRKFPQQPLQYSSSCHFPQPFQVSPSCPHPLHLPIIFQWPGLQTSSTDATLPRDLDLALGVSMEPNVINTPSYASGPTCVLNGYKKIQTSLLKYVTNHDAA